MIISCTNCKKKFEVKDNLIPESGRLLQCSACMHKWFFKNETLVLKKTPSRKIISTTQENQILEEKIPNDIEKIITEAEVSKSNKKKKLEHTYKSNSSSISFLSSLLLIIITFSALVILLDTFKNSINDLYPGFNFLLENFYESLKDLFFFFKDLIR